MHSKPLLAAVLASAGIHAAWAQQPHGHDHAHHQHQQEQHQQEQEQHQHQQHQQHDQHDQHDQHGQLRQERHQQHGQHGQQHHRAEPSPSAAASPDTGAMPPSMDHGEMKMQGGSAPPDARDPHGYSGGYRRGVGKYALGEQHRLHMADEHRFGSLLVDRLEWARGSDTNAAAYEAQAWFGNSYDKFVIKAEGEVERGKVHEARTELLWGHAIASYWDTQLGIRNDAGHGRPGRNWLAFGVQGLAPYWFEIDATGYLGNEGRTALRLSVEYELLITQRLILQPRVEANIYGKNDREVGVGNGLSNGAAGVRLRYEFSRQFAPYIGVERYQTFGNTADMVRASGGRSGETRFVAGVRIWF